MDIAQGKKPAPIFSLPIELTLQIFTLHIEQSGNNGPPWTLAQVCHEWRHFILYTPRFWSNIRICFNRLKGSKNLHNWSRYKDLTSLHLERSRDHPLDIFIQINVAHHSLRSFLRAIASMIFRSQCRWKSFELAGHHGAQFHEALRAFGPFPMECPLLERLYLHFSAPFNRQTWPFYGNNLPRLRRVRFSGALPPSDSLPWAQIEDFGVSDVDRLPYVLPDVSKHFSNLQVFDLSHHHWDSALWFHEPTPPGCHPFPKVHACTFSTRTFALGWFTMPVLRKLGLEITKNETEVTAIVAFIHRSECHLTSFYTLLDTRMRTFIPVLKEMNALQNLHIVISTHRKDQETDSLELCRALNLVDGDSFRYCPELRSLTLCWKIGVNEKAGDISLLLDMLERRSTAACAGTGRPFGLQEVRLRRIGSWIGSEDLTNRLSMLREGGMDVILTSGSLPL